MLAIIFQYQTINLNNLNKNKINPIIHNTPLDIPHKTPNNPHQHPNLHKPKHNHLHPHKLLPQSPPKNLQKRYNTNHVHLHQHKKDIPKNWQ